MTNKAKQARNEYYKDRNRKSKELREKRNAKAREYYRTHKEIVKATQARYWERKAIKAELERQAALQADADQ